MEQQEPIPANVAVILTTNKPTLFKIDAFEIESTSDRDQLLDYSKNMKAVQKALEKEFEPEIAKAFSLHRGLCAMKTKFIKPFRDRELLCDAKIVKWNRIQDEKAAVEAQKRREEADAEAKRKEDAERKRIEEERLSQATNLEELGFKEEAEAVLEKPVVVNIAPEVPPPVVPEAKMEGSHMRDNWSGEIVDPMLLIQEIVSGRQSIGLLFKKNADGKWEFNPKAIDDQAKSLKGELLIPGVKAINRPTLVKR